MGGKTPLINKILLVDAEDNKLGSTDIQWGHHPLGLMYLASNISRAHPEVQIRIFHTITCVDVIGDLTRLLDEFEPEAIGIRCLNRFKKDMQDIVNHIRSCRPGLPIIAGGPYPTSSYEEVLKNHDADIVVLGEGELTMIDLIEHLSQGVNMPTDILGTAVLKDTEVITPPCRPYMDVSQLASPDYHLIDLNAYSHVYNQAFISSANCAYIFSSRGCPFQCGYCHDLFGKNVRRIPPELIVQEVRTHINERGIRDFVFVDDIFNVPLENGKEVLRQLCKAFAPGQIRLYFPNGLRADQLDDEFIELLGQANTQQVSLAVETASPRLQRMIGKNLDLSKAREAIDKISRRFITTVLFMTGFPTETLTDAMATIEFAETLEYIAQPVLSILRVFPQTAIYKRLAPTEQQEEVLKRQAEMQFAPKLLEDIGGQGAAFYGDIFPADKVPLKTKDIRMLEYTWVRNVIYSKRRIQRSHTVIQRYRTGQDLIDYYRFIFGNPQFGDNDLQRLLQRMDG